MAPGESLNWWNCPPLIRKRVRNTILFTILLGLAAPAYVILRGPLGISYEPWGRYGALVFGITPVIIIWPLYLLQRTRLNKAFIDAGGRLCIHCGYNLSTLGEHGTCPECGKNFNREQDDAVWESAGFSCRQ